MRLFALSLWVLPFFIALNASIASLGLAQDEKGGEDLQKATDLKITANSGREFDEIADLCESAIEKGLNEESEAFAKQLWVSTLYEHAQLFTDKIFDGDYGQRWPIYRRQAISRLEKAVEIDPDFADGLILLARLNMELPGGDKDSAKSSIEKIIKAAGDDKEKLVKAYILQAQAADDNDARLESLTKALEADPDNIQALRIRGTLYLAEDKLEEAVADFKKIVGADAGDSTSFAIVCESLTELEKYEEALEFANQAIENDPEDPTNYLLTARVHAAQENYDEVYKAVDKALEIDDENLEVLLFRANIFLMQDKHDEAMDDVKKMLSFAPNNVQVIYTRSFVNLDKEEYDKAIADLRLIYENFKMSYLRNEQIAPILNRYTNDMGMFHTIAKRSREAIDYYEEVLDRDQDNKRALRGRADAYLNLGEHADAIRDYKRGLELDPDDSGILNNYSWVLATSPDDELRDGKLSIELAIKACELTDYEQAHILSTLASGYAETGDFETARKWAAKAVELAEDDEQREGLQEELDSYNKNEPWRERENEDEEREKEKAEKEDTDKESDKEEEDNKDENKDDDDGDDDDGDDGRN